MLSRLFMVVLFSNLAGCRFVVNAVQASDDGGGSDSSISYDAHPRLPDAAHPPDAQTPRDASAPPDAGSCVPGGCPTGQYCISGVCTDLSNGLVTYWKMDDLSWINGQATVKDSTGTQLDGTYHTKDQAYNPSVPGRNGSRAHAFDADENQNITFDPSTALDFGDGDFSIATWVYLNKTSVQQPLWYAMPQTINGPRSRFFHSASKGWTFEIRDGSTKLLVVEEGSVTTSSAAWYHVALVRYHDEFTLFLDGLAIGTPQTYAAALPVNDGSRIAKLEGSSNSYFSGMLEEFRIYNRALTVEELQALAF